MFEQNAGNIQPDPAPKAGGEKTEVSREKLCETLEQIQQKADTMFRQAGTPEDKRAFLAIRNLAEGVLRPRK